MGIHPETGVLTASDQEGHSVPSTVLLLVNEGDYYGVPATAHREPVPEITPPLVWLPHSADPSGISQVWITGDRMGALSGEMIHFSYGRPGLFRVLFDSRAVGPVQGALLRPADRVLEGYDDGMPSFLGILSEEAVESVVLYIRSLSDEQLD